MSFLNLIFEFQFQFKFKWCSLFLYHLHVDSKIDELWTNVMSLYKANHMSVF